jgi:adenylate cyclase
MKLSLRRSLAIRITALLVGTLAVLGTVAFFRARLATDDLSSRLIGQASEQVDGKVVGLLERAESQGRLMSRLVASSPQSDDRAGFRALAETGLKLMEANTVFSSVAYVLDKTGESVQVVRRPNGSLAVNESVARGAGYWREESAPFGDDRRFVSSGPDPRPDPRAADWYQAARKTREQAWAKTAILRDPGGQDAPGVTVATPVFDRENRLIGMVAVTLTLTDLSRFLQTVKVGESGFPFIVEFGEQVRVIAYPDINSFLFPEGTVLRLAKIEEIGRPLVVSLVEKIEAQMPGLRDGPVRRIDADFEGRRYLVGVKRIGGDRGLDWVLCVVVPELDFMASVYQTGIGLVVLGSLAVLGAVLFAVLVSRRVASPLQDLVVETERVRAFDLASRPLPPTNIKEIDRLAESMEQMKTGLRSFEKMVPGDYARWLLETGQEARLGGERRRITVYFGDIRGFTALSHRIEPEELVEILAEYLDVLSGEVIRHGGTVDKFNGDDVMAFWGAPGPCPEHARLACTAAVHSQRTISHLHTEWADGSKPLLTATFGVATGEVVVGNVGSRQRMNYTAIGDAVNLASRLQGLNRFYSTDALISDVTRLEAGDSIVTRLVDWVTLYGREEPVAVYELIDLTEDAQPAVVAVAKLHDQAMQSYRLRDFSDALQGFLSVLSKWPEDGPARILASRCAEFLEKPPPEDWNGATPMTVK